MRDNLMEARGLMGGVRGWFPRGKASSCFIPGRVTPPRCLDSCGHVLPMHKCGSWWDSIPDVHLAAWGTQSSGS